ncbi:Gfo/Idh/MocA family oxidoreductase [Stigmatella sp. ncwal1]|uniref:Gfo/Idh/MocA family oxidoreductase n=1 Tax=Stigmatella ashevillensis TaxID=2995309 RepID=A0ABT5DHE5_9BACT|nr:Gfo/Idh/MocA family oxidoreductase [Stigmatella ashevillena]MDC0713033.1 Gfo/Idh/MocA family oxidoreductase [Stigmatella ashevillena]
MRIGIIGTGWGLMHVGAFRAAGAEVAALCGRRLDATREVAARERIPLATTDVRELCDAVDAVVVASPDAAHREHVARALDAGRAVLCEKPLARTNEEAQALVEKARAVGRPCVVNFPYRMLPTLRALKGWLAHRTPRHLIVTLRNGFVPVEGDGPGPFMGTSADWGGFSHVLDAALWLSGATPTWLQASLSGRPVHTAALHVGLSSGAVLVLTHAACAEPGIHGGWSLLGSGWEAGFSAGYVPSRNGWCLSPVSAFHEGLWRELSPGLEPHPGAREPWAEAHVETARNFLSVLQGGPLAGLATVEEGATVQRLLAAAVESEQQGRRITLGPTPPAPPSSPA